MRRTALALLAAGLVAAGCGDGSDGNDEDAASILERGFASDVDTGLMTLDATVALEGVEELDEPLRLTMEGPFRAAGSPTEVPDLDMEIHASGAGQEFDGRVIVTRENAWVEYRGSTYEVGAELWTRLIEALRDQSQGPESLSEAGVDPLDWIDGAERDGEEQQGGTRATRVTATMDVEAVLRDFNRLAGAGGERIPERALDEVGEVVDDVELEAWIGEDDIWRRISAETDFEVPEDERDTVGGLKGGSVSLDVELDRPNEPVEIAGPAEARPIDELLRQLGIPPEALLGPGFVPPSAG